MKHENKIEIFLCRLLDNKNFLVEILPRYGWKAELNAAKNINHWTRVRKFIEVSAFVKSPNLRWTQDIILWSISHIRSFQVKRPTFRGTNHNKMTKWNKAKKVSECMSIEWLNRKIRKTSKAWQNLCGSTALSVLTTEPFSTRISRKLNFKCNLCTEHLSSESELQNHQKNVHTFLFGLQH